MNHHASLLLPALLVLPAVSAGQEAGDQSVDANSRVERALKTLRETESFTCKSTVTSKADALARQLGGGKTSHSRLQMVREGDIVCWSKNDGDEVLARRGAHWVVLDRDGEWIPCRKPEGDAWSSEYLADPSFLAGRLLHLLKKTKWQGAGSQEIDGKPVRVYKCVIELDDANYLVRTGALPASGGALGGMMGRAFMVVGGGGGGMRMKEPDRKVELELHEDPSGKIPLKVVARMFAEGGAMGQLRIAVQGLGGGTDDDEEEEGGDKKKKPAYTLELEIGDAGAAKASLLSKSARRMLER